MADGRLTIKTNPAAAAAAAAAAAGTPGGMHAAASTASLASLATVSSVASLASLGGSGGGWGFGEAAGPAGLLMWPSQCPVCSQLCVAGGVCRRVSTSTLCWQGPVCLLHMWPGTFRVAVCLLRMPRHLAPCALALPGGAEPQPACACCRCKGTHQLSVTCLHSHPACILRPADDAELDEEKLKEKQVGWALTVGPC